MLQILYILAFTVLAALAITSLIRNLIMFSREAQDSNIQGFGVNSSSMRKRVPHPELVDDHGNVIDEPLLVMRSMTVDDAREQLDALYRQSPGPTEDL